MTRTASKVLFWTPRIICMIFIPFLMLFSLDVFEGDHTAKEIAIGLFMHNIPAFALILFLWAAWKREWIGAVVFAALGAFYILWAWGKFDIWVYIFISGPLFVMSLLFLLGWLHRKEIRLRKIPPAASALTLVLVAGLLTGCATFRSELGHRYEGETRRNDSKPVSVCFVFSHVYQMVGFDAIPKLENKRQRLMGFDDIFLDAQRELTNLGKYATFTDEASDVNDPVRRALKDSLMSVHDYTVKIRIEAKKKFTNYFLGSLASTVTATVAPVPYVQYYTLTADVFDRDRKLIASYHRRANLTKWVEALLIVIYPFHPEARKREEIYMDFLHDLFRQIESEGVLKSQ